MKPGWLGLGSSALCLSLLAFGCAQLPPTPHRTQSRVAPTRAVVAASHPANGLVLTVEIPVVYLPNSRSEIATLVVENSSKTPVTFGDAPEILVFDARLKTVYDSSPSSARRTPVLVTLRPGERVTHAVRFVVPPPGSYTLVASSGPNDPFGPGGFVHFVSIRGHY